MLAGAAMAAACACGAEFALEWNPRFPTDVPYEVELSPAKLGAEGFTVKADGRALETLSFPGKAEGTLALRFRVPDGTRALACATGPKRAPCASDGIDNLFAGALGAAAKWTVPADVARTTVAGGLRFACASAGDRVVTCDVPVPAALNAAGRAVPMKIELDVRNAATMTWAELVEFVQLDAAGRELPERLSDKRWTSHLLPAGRAVSYRENGSLHPRARTLRLSIRLYGRDRTVDEYGMPRQPGPDALPQLEITRLAVRPAAVLPFPGLDASFFTAGVSGRAGDRALVLGPERGFWYQTRGNASWAGCGYQYRDENEIFFPSADGTVEAWFRPEWPAASADQPFYLFEGSSHTLALKPKAVEYFGRRELFAVTYVPKTRTLAFYRKDMKDREYRGEATADIPAGRWTHVACTFVPGGTARVFVDGRKALEVSLAGYAALDLKNDPLANNTDVVAAYIGSELESASCRPEPYPWRPLFCGAVDCWRVSTGVRYPADFTPAKEFAVDAATRAYFGFDDSLTGVSGGGAGWIPGSLRAEKWTVRRTVAVDGRTVRYYPEEILPENDPDKVLDRLNYPVMPTPDDFRAARRQVRRTFSVGEDGTFAKFDLKGPVYPDYVEIANNGTEALRYPIVLNLGELDARSFGDMADSLCAVPMSDRERANKTFNFLLRSCDYFINDTATYEPDCPTPESVQNKALMMINGYCGFECGPLNTLACNLFACSAKCPASMTAGYGHSFQQVFFDGKNHIYDLSAQKFFPWWDNETSVYLEEDAYEPGIHNRLGANSSHFIRHGTRHAWPGEPGYRVRTGVTVRPGERFRAWFDNAGECNDLYCSPRVDQWIKQRTRNFFNPETVGEECLAVDPKVKLRRFERFFPQYANGYLEFDGRPDAANEAFRDEGGTFRFRVESGYPIVAGDYRAFRRGGGEAALEFSFDGCRTWHALPSGRVEYPVKARLGYWVRVKAPMKDVARFAARTVLQLNARVFPGKVRAGANELRFKRAGGGRAEVTLAWREDARPIAFRGAALTGFLPGAEKATVLVDPACPLDVEVEGASSRATVTASEGLSAKFADGRLTVAADAAKAPFVGFVSVRDGEAEKALTVVACAGARWVPAGAAKLAGGAKLLPADADRAQPCAYLEKPGDRAVFTFAPLPKGRYTVWNVNRFASHIKLTEAKLALSVDGEPKKATGAVGSNWLINYFKAQYGQPGGRACFKWDAALDPKTFRPYWGVCAFDCPKGLGRVTYHAPVAVEGGVELAGVLVLPWSDEARFRRELLKVLGGVNCAPERVGRRD